MWPWSRIRELEYQVSQWKEKAACHEKWRFRYEAESLYRTRDLLAAHKGIRRLVEKVKRWKKGRASLEPCIRRLDTLQADLTIHPEGCPEPWRTWLVGAHAAMCQTVETYRKE